MQLNREKLEARISELEVQYSQEHAKSNQTLGAINELRAVMSYLATPEAPDNSIKKETVV